MQRIKTHPIFSLGLYILIALMMMSVCRICFYIYNYEILETNFDTLLTVLKCGITFDLSIILVANILFIVCQAVPIPYRYRQKYQHVVIYFYLLPVSICIFMNLLDTIYFEVTFKRTTFAVFSQFSNESNLIHLFSLFILDYWYMLILILILISGFVLIAKQVNFVDYKSKMNLKHYMIDSVLFCFIMYMTIAGIRGGFTGKTRPITLSNASKCINDPKHRALVLNTPFAVYRTLRQKPLQVPKYFEDQNELNQHVSFYKKGVSKDSIFHKKNVVLFIIESFGKENIGGLNKDIPNYKGYTPHFDSLMNHSLVFNKAVANGRQSITGMPSTIASIPSLKTAFILSLYSGNKINSLATELGKMNYYTAFFHGSTNGSMGFDAFANQAGFDDYFGMSEYPNNEEDYDGTWGIWDDKFFQFFSDKMDSMKTPFFTSIFTLSSHHPYQIPEKYKDRFESGPLQIHKTIRYVDFALNEFLKSASKKKWYKNTLFIFTADHTPAFSYLPEYKNILGYYSVPIVFFDPSNEKLVGYVDDYYVQQTDIMPSVLSYLNYPNDYIAFGKNAFGDKVYDKDWAVCSDGGSYFIFSQDFLGVFNEDILKNVYNLKKDRYLKENIILHIEDSIKTKLENRVKAYIQDLNRRFIENDMTVEK